MDSTDDFTRRVQAMLERAGSRKALARWLGKSDTAILAWENGSKPFASTLREICDETGLSFAWLKDGIGDETVELAKVRPVTLAEAEQSALIREAPIELRDSMEYILQHGSPDQLEVLQTLAEKMARQISARGEAPRYVPGKPAALRATRTPK